MSLHTIVCILAWLDKGFGCHIYFYYDFIVIQLSQTAEPKDYIYSVACEV